MGSEFYRYNVESRMASMPVLDTCTEVTANLLKLPGGRGGRFKLPNLTELHAYLFGVPFAEAHNATADVEATTRCFFELVRREVFTAEELEVDSGYFVDFKTQNPFEIPTVGLKHVNLKAASEEIRQELKAEDTAAPIELDAELLNDFENAEFAHLHNHSQFSVLQSTISIPNLVAAAAKLKMPAVAITDHGNMMGAFHFVSKVGDHNKAAAEKNKELEEAGESPTEKIINKSS